MAELRVGYQARVKQNPVSPVSRTIRGEIVGFNGKSSIGDLGYVALLHGNEITGKCIALPLCDLEPRVIDI
jgi:hypothetical protein